MKLGRSIVAAVAPICVWAPVLVSGCTSTNVIHAELDPPEGARSLVLGVEQEDQLDVQAFNIDATPDMLPSFFGYDESKRFVLWARYYDATLEDLGVPPGVLSSVSVETEFGPLPPTSLEDSHRVIVGDDDGGWQPGPAISLEAFRSPLLPLDDDACLTWRATTTLQLETHVVVNGIVGLPGGAAVAVAGFVPSADRGLDDLIYRVYEDAPGIWAVKRVDETAPFLSLAGAGRLTELAAAADGRLYVTSCRWQPAAGTWTSTVWAQRGGDSFEPVTTRLRAGPAPTPEIPLDCDFDTLIPVGASELAIHSARDGEIAWFRDDGRAWTEQERMSTAGPSLAIAQALDGTLVGSRRAVRPSAYRVVGRSSIVDEELEGALDIEKSQVLASARSGVLMATSSGVLDDVTRFHRRSETGGWTALGNTETQIVRAVAPYAERGILFSGLFGFVAQWSPTTGFCAADPDRSRVPLFDPLGGLVELAPRVFVTGGRRNLARDDLPSPLVVIQGQPTLP